MRNKLLAARETFRNCAFRSLCNEGAKTDPESCSRCSEPQLQKLVRRFRSSSR